MGAPGIWAQGGHHQPASLLSVAWPGVGFWALCGHCVFVDRSLGSLSAQLWGGALTGDGSAVPQPWGHSPLPVGFNSRPPATHAALFALCRLPSNLPRGRRVLFDLVPENICPWNGDGGPRWVEALRMQPGRGTADPQKAWRPLPASEGNTGDVPAGPGARVAASMWRAWALPLCPTPPTVTAGRGAPCGDCILPAKTPTSKCGRHAEGAVWDPGGVVSAAPDQPDRWQLWARRGALAPEEAVDTPLQAPGGHRARQRDCGCGLWAGEGAPAGMLGSLGGRFS